ncbi:hypothetical protein GCM10027575_77070 [Phytohabitans suffuscus]
MHVVVRLREGAHALEPGCRPPALQRRARMGPGVAGEVDEKLVDAEQVGQVGAVGQVPPSPASLILAREVVAALGSDDLDAELPKYV